jgi:cholesterol transport system auxiliary component
MRNPLNFGAIVRLASTAPRLAALLPVFAVLGACGIGPQVKEPPASYDLGPPHPYLQTNPGIRMALLIPAIVAPTWLDGQGIAYRLNYVDAARPQTYANSQWAATPSALLTQRLRSRFAAASGIVGTGDGARADYALRVELEDFSQSFDALNQSRVAVRVRATLVDLSSHTLHAQRTFGVERPAEPDAAGAVTALGVASDALIEELLRWTAQNLKDMAPK